RDGRNSSCPMDTAACSTISTPGRRRFSPSARARRLTTSTACTCSMRAQRTDMTNRIDPFVDVLLREGADQLYLLPDEPVTVIKEGKPRKVSKQPLTDQHIYALLVEVAPPEAADKIDQGNETEFEYAATRGLVRVRVVPETGRLTAVVAPIQRDGTAKTGAKTAAPGDVTAPRHAIDVSKAASAKRT